MWTRKEAIVAIMLTVLSWGLFGLAYWLIDANFGV